MSNKHFTLVVIGDNHSERVKNFDNNLKVDKYLLWEFKKSKQYYEQAIKYYELMSKNLNGLEKDECDEYLSHLKSIDDIEYYIELTSDMDVDSDTGNVYSELNQNGKYDACNLGKNLSMPLILKDGSESFSAKKKDIDWSRVHLCNQDVYKNAWELVMEGREPLNDEERNIYNNMKERTEYFNFFGNKENYVMSSTAFWGYAILDSDDKWYELDDNIDQIKWVSEFYDRFISKLDDDTIISIYECIRK